jgi:hypothetical protein
MSNAKPGYTGFQHILAENIHVGDSITVIWSLWYKAVSSFPPEITPADARIIGIADR